MILDELFTHELVLESEEPGLVKRAGGSKPISVDKNMNEENGSSRVLPPTWTGILEEGCIKLYGESPIIEDLGSENGEHKIQICVAAWRAISCNRNKTTAKHYAAKEILCKIIRDGQFSKFGIPGQNAEEAQDFIEKMMPELRDEELQEAVQVNYIGKLDQLFMRKHVNSRVQYDYTESGVPNNRRFRCNAKMGDYGSVFADANRKQDAKNLAASRLYKKIVEELNIKFDLANSRSNSVQSVDENDPYELTLPPENKAPGELITAGSLIKNLIENPDSFGALLKSIVSNPNDCTNCEQILLALLNSKDPQIEKVFGNAEIRCFETASKGGDADGAQVYLELITKIQTDSSKDPKEVHQINVFGGQGSTEKAAKDNACWQALQYLYFFGDFGPIDD